MNFQFNQPNTSTPSFQTTQSPVGSPGGKRRKFKRIERSAQFDDPEDKERVRKELELKKELHRLHDLGMTETSQYQQLKDEINKLRLISMTKADERAKEEEEENGMLTTDD
jgi:hypothetical protein